MEYWVLTCQMMGPETLTWSMISEKDSQSWGHGLRLCKPNSKSQNWSLNRLNITLLREGIHCNPLLISKQSHWTYQARKRLMMIKWMKKKKRVGLKAIWMRSQFWILIYNYQLPLNHCKCKQWHQIFRAMKHQLSCHPLLIMIIRIKITKMIIQARVLLFDLLAWKVAILQRARRLLQSAQ